MPTPGDVDARPRSIRAIARRLSRPQFAIALGAAVVAVALAACGGFGSPSPTTCDGISSEFGGCDTDRPTFVGETCAEIGREYGAQISAGSLEIYNGPEDPEESRAVRAGQLNVVALSLANKRLRDLGIVDECEAEEFMAAAEPEFAPEFKEQAGVYLYDGPPLPYTEWRAETLDLIRGLIDQEEDLPYGG
jgi:hypothetical protein